MSVTPSASTMALLNCASFTASSWLMLYFSSGERLEAATFCISNCVCFKPAASSGDQFCRLRGGEGPGGLVNGGGDLVQGRR